MSSIFNFVYVGRFVRRQKRIDLVVDLFKKLNRECSNSTFIMIGGTSAELVKELGYNPQFVEVIPRVDNWIDAASQFGENFCLVICSDYEGVPLVLLENAIDGSNYFLMRDRPHATWITDKLGIVDQDALCDHGKRGLFSRLTEDEKKFFTSKLRFKDDVLRIFD